MKLSVVTVDTMLLSMLGSIAISLIIIGHSRGRAAEGDPVLPAAFVYGLKHAPRALLRLLKLFLEILHNRSQRHVLRGQSLNRSLSSSSG